MSLPPSHQFAKLNGEEKSEVHNKWSLFYKVLFSQRAFSGYEDKTLIYETLNTEKEILWEWCISKGSDCQAAL